MNQLWIHLALRICVKVAGSSLAMHYVISVNLSAEALRDELLSETSTPGILAHLLVLSTPNLWFSKVQISASIFSLSVALKHVE